MARRRRHHPCQRARRFRPLLHPLAGRRLRRELRAPRVAAAARALPEGLRGDAFERLLRRIDGGPVLGGNAVEVFTRGEEAFAAMRAAARAATRELLLESYIFKDDAPGRLFLEEAAAAAARGVAVRVMADAAGSQATGEGFWREMAARGIEVRLFDPLLPGMWWFQPFRDHRKLLVVDRRVAFTGGMNIGDEYGSPRPRRGTRWRDTGLRVEGPAAWELAVVFAEGWERAGGGAFTIERLEAAAAERPGARVLVLDSRPWRGQVESAAVLAAVVGAARRRVWITNAYFAPGGLGVEVLAGAAERGLDVRLLLAGVTDVPLLRHAAHGYYAELLARGVRVFEYGGQVLHAKTLVADGFASVVGSSNLDFRSFVFNAECNLVVLDEATGATLEAAFERDLAAAREVLPETLGRRSVPHRLGDVAARWLSPVL